MTLLVTAAILWYARLNGMTFIDLERPMRMRLWSMLVILPLILILLLGTRYPKKDYDERDLIIDRKSLGAGFVAGFIFLFAAGVFVTVTSKPFDTLTNIYIWMRFSFLLYLAAFVSFLATSIASLIQYGREGKCCSSEGIESSG